MANRNLMRHRGCAAIVVLVVLVIQATAIQAQEKASSDRPNIILIVTDDQRWDAVGYSGNRIIHTPEMDRLAAEGTRFSHAFVTTPICAASRASFLTGLYERAHGYTFQVDKIRDEDMARSYPKLLRDSGYYTGFFGKLGVKFDNSELMFDHHEFFDRHPKYEDRRGYYYKTLQGDTVHLTPYTGARAMEFITSAPADRPFCLSISFSAPHAHDPAPDQYFWEPDVNGLYSDMSMPAPEISEDRYFQSLPVMVREGFNRTRWTWRYDTPEKYQHSVKGYYRMISGVDREIGKIRALLREKGLDKNTIIIMMGDNGYFLGERQLAGKWLMYDNSIRVPLVVYDPKAKAGLEVSEPALNIDVPATMLHYAGLTVPRSWQGRSLLPLIHGQETRLHRDTILFEHLWEMPNIPPSEGVRTKQWKYFRYINDKTIEELYNLDSDPKETNNLARNRKYKKVLASLRRKCDALVEEHRSAYAGVPIAVKVECAPANSKPDVKAVYHWNLPAKASSQKAFQILVSSSQENIDNNIGDVWDTGRMEGSSLQVSHGGTPLLKGKQYFWKVRIWDHDARMTEYGEVKKFSPPRK